MRAHRPQVVQQPELTREQKNINVLETAFPMQQFRRSEWPQGTVTFCQSQSMLQDYEWRSVDTTTIGASQVFRPGEVQSWYVNARVRFYVVFIATSPGVEAPLSPYSAPHSRWPGISILPTITPLELLIWYTQCFPHYFLYVLLIASLLVFIVSLMVHNSSCSHEFLHALHFMPCYENCMCYVDCMCYV